MLCKSNIEYLHKLNREFILLLKQAPTQPGGAAVH